MKTFTFNAETSRQLLKDLDSGCIVKLSKSNGAAIILSDGLDIDEFGDHIYRMTIQPAKGEATIKNVPMNETDMWNLCFGEKFALYEIINK